MLNTARGVLSTRGITEILSKGSVISLDAHNQFAVVAIHGPDNTVVDIPERWVAILE
jgi:hypothetical protein